MKGDCASAAPQASRTLLYPEPGSSPITSPLLLPKHIRSKGPSLHRHYPASPVLRPFPSPSPGRHPFRRRWSATSTVLGLPQITHTTFSACRAHYPGGPDRCTCRLLPCPRGLPRISGGSASATSLSRPAQASLTLRPTSSLAHHTWALLRGFDPTSHPIESLVSYQVLPTTTWVGPSPTRDLRRWGALRQPVNLLFAVR